MLRAQLGMPRAQQITRCSAHHARTHAGSVRMHGVRMCATANYRGAAHGREPGGRVGAFEPSAALLLQHIAHLIHRIVHHLIEARGLHCVPNGVDSVLEDLSDV